MATEADIAYVTENISKEAAELGWDQTRITNVLDSGVSPVGAIRNFWQYRVAQTVNFVDVSESGSSRSLSTIHKNALSLLDYWDKRLKDDEAVDPEETTRGRIAFHKATRV